MLQVLTAFGCKQVKRFFNFIILIYKKLTNKRISLCRQAFYSIGNTASEKENPLWSSGRNYDVSLTYFAFLLKYSLEQNVMVF
jgi:hypothetical protein